jgi:hypothetical protein
MRGSGHRSAEGRLRAPPDDRWSVGFIGALLLLSPAHYEIVGGGAR